MKKKQLLSLYKLKNTVFTLKEIALLWQESNYANLKARINYYVQQKMLYSPRRGIYTVDANYNRQELGAKLYTPAYISLETVLQREGMVFQYDSAIYVISYLSRSINCENQNYVYRRINNKILLNLLGIEQNPGYYIATKERALLDCLYLNKTYHFDNLQEINWDFCFEIAEIYESKVLIKSLKELRASAGNK
ncbi:hypothetical protein ACFL2K_00805 [Candidatus Margulisiibacteriota bacterium]